MPCNAETITRYDVCPELRRLPSGPARAGSSSCAKPSTSGSETASTIGHAWQFSTIHAVAQNMQPFAHEAMDTAELYDPSLTAFSLSPAKCCPTARRLIPRSPLKRPERKLYLRERCYGCVA